MIRLTNKKGGTMPKISKKKINYCKKGNFFWVKWKENLNDNYEHIMAKPLFEQIVHSLGKQGFEVTN
tara:strand:+ start:35 stop:235 length:201 start_codon:yes stop_codon:yes gene_type:complete